MVQLFRHNLQAMKLLEKLGQRKFRILMVLEQKISGLLAILQI
ncbi:Uncharacterised protein [Chlamydia trachomatis]|nr:Uncharacterised protein [Chlamydia trachomatis]